MSGRAGRVKSIFLVAALVVACGALSHGRPSSAEPDGAKADAGNGGAAESSRAPGDRGQRRPPDARPPVVVLPPAPSAYESVPQESLTEWVAKVNERRPGLSAAVRAAAEEEPILSVPALRREVRRQAGRRLLVDPI